MVLFPESLLVVGPGSVEGPLLPISKAATPASDPMDEEAQFVLIIRTEAWAENTKQSHSARHAFWGRDGCAQSTGIPFGFKRLGWPLVGPSSAVWSRTNSHSGPQFPPPC